MVAGESPARYHFSWVMKHARLCRLFQKRENLMRDYRKKLPTPAELRVLLAVKRGQRTPCDIAQSDDPNVYAYLREMVEKDYCSMSYEFRGERGQRRYTITKRGRQICQMVERLHAL